MNGPLSPKLLRGRLQLMLAHPYLAAALARLPVVDASNLPWCEAVATDGYHIYVNPTYFEVLPENQVKSVFAHVVMHCVLGHMDRRRGRDRTVWDAAVDHATNLLLREFGFDLPTGALCGSRFKGKTAEDVFIELQKEPTPGTRSGSRFDLHIEPGDAEGAAVRSKDYPSEDERRRLRAAILNEMKRGLKHGTLPGELERGALQATRAEVSWRQMLAQLMSGLRRSDYRLFPFNKKHLWRGIYLPSLGVPGPDHLVLAIDTSGSVSAEMLGQFLKELDVLRSLAECRLTLLHCDAAVQRVEEIGIHEAATQSGESLSGRSLAGGGGTDFRPVFDWITERGRAEAVHPDALIYCTDGFGAFPSRPPSYPVAWVAPCADSRSFRLDE